MENQKERICVAHGLPNCNCEEKNPTPTFKDFEEVEKIYSDKSKKLFTHGGFCVLLDYPPHESVLDENLIKQFLRQTYLSARKAGREEAIGETIEWIDKNYSGRPEIIVVKNQEDAIDQIHNRGFDTALEQLKAELQKLIK